jgi:hypothetical protein
MFDGSYQSLAATHERLAEPVGESEPESVVGEVNPAGQFAFDVVVEFIAELIFNI